jgi:hypothetical protein
MPRIRTAASASAIISFLEAEATLEDIVITPFKAA